jgi:hypothetical protein
VLFPWPPSKDPEAYRYESWADRRAPKPSKPRIPRRIHASALVAGWAIGVLAGVLLGKDVFLSLVAGGSVATLLADVGWSWHVRHRHA